MGTYCHLCDSLLSPLSSWLAESTGSSQPPADLLEPALARWPWATSGLLPRGDVVFNVLKDTGQNEWAFLKQPCLRVWTLLSTCMPSTPTSLLLFLWVRPPAACVTLGKPPKPEYSLLYTIPYSVCPILYTIHTVQVIYCYFPEL